MNRLSAQEFRAVCALVYFVYPAVVDRQDAIRLLDDAIVVGTYCLPLLCVHRCDYTGKRRCHHGFIRLFVCNPKRLLASASCTRAT